MLPAPFAEPQKRGQVRELPLGVGSSKDTEAGAEASATELALPLPHPAQSVTTKRADNSTEKILFS